MPLFPVSVVRPDLILLCSLRKKVFLRSAMFSSSALQVLLLSVLKTVRCSKNFVNLSVNLLFLQKSLTHWRKQRQQQLVSVIPLLFVLHLLSAVQVADSLTTKKSLLKSVQMHSNYLLFIRLLLKRALRVIKKLSLRLCVTPMTTLLQSAVWKILTPLVFIQVTLALWHLL